MECEIFGIILKLTRDHLPGFFCFFLFFFNLHDSIFIENAGGNFGKIVLLLLGLMVGVPGPIVTKMKTQLLTNCALISKENAWESLMVISVTVQL